MILTYKICIYITLFLKNILEKIEKYLFVDLENIENLYNEAYRKVLKKYKMLKNYVLKFDM